MRLKLKELRQRHGHSQRDAANGTATTKENFGFIENGKRIGTLPFWLRLQAFYELSNAEIWDIAKEGVSLENNNTPR